MSQAVTQILLSQQAFTPVQAALTGIGSINGNVLTLTSGSPPFPIGAGIRGTDSLGVQIPAGTTISAQGPTVSNALAYYITPPMGVPLQQTVINTIQGTVGNYEVVGERRPAASYYVSCKCLQTLNINTLGFSGTLIVEASLSTDPSTSTAEPSDWFTVYSVIADAQAVSGSAAALASNTNIGVNIDGNFVWMRARVINFSGGIVNWVKLSY